MDEESNGTYITLDGHVEIHKYGDLYFMIVLIFYILIICSNSTIVCLIRIHRNLHEPMYVFIAALLINTLLLSTTIYPKLLIDFLLEKQVISYSACLLQYFLYYTFIGSEFLLLSAMAYDRYVSICKPLQYPTIMRKTTITVFLVFSWIFPGCQLAGLATVSANQKLCDFTLKIIYCNNSFYKLFCISSRAISVYGVVIFLNLVGLPVVFIVFTYTRILIICYQSCGEVRKKAAQTCLPHLLVLINYFFLISFDIITVRLDSDLPKNIRLIMTLQLVLYNPLFNPIIYGLKMKEISKHLKRLFCSDS